MAFGDTLDFGVLTFTPTSGPVGTKVTVFSPQEPVTGIQLNNMNVGVNYDLNNGTYFFNVPNGATSGRIKVFFVGGSLTSNASFTVTSGPPVSTTPKITSFNPTSGPGNTRVTVFGENLGGTNSATIAGRTCILLAILPSQVVMDLPGNAVTGRIVLSGADGTATSPTDFVVTSTAFGITGFGPTSGGLGVRVDVFGTGFNAATQAGIGNTFTNQITKIDDTHLHFKVPSGATTGKVTVKTATLSASSTADFTVIQLTPPPPGIADFNPKMGGANTQVIITGVNFESFVSLKLGTLAITPTLVFPDRIDFVVPQGAVSGRIEVKTQFGTATTTQDFVVQQPAGLPDPIISNIDPFRGTITDQITITGMNLNFNPSVSINGREQQNVTVEPTKVVFRIVPQTTTGFVTILTTGNGQSKTTTFMNAQLEISNDGLPLITGFTPLQQEPGKDVSVFGTNFEDLQSVKVGNMGATFKDVTSTSFKLVVPQLAPGMYFLEVNTLRGQVFSGEQLKVIPKTTTTGISSFMLNPIQPIPEPEPKVSNEDAPDFNGADSVASLTLIAGQSHTFRLFAKRFDMQTDTVTVKLQPAPQQGLEILFPPTVQANVGFDVTVRTQPTLEPITQVFNFSGLSSRNPGVEYAPFTLSLTVKAPLVFKLPDVVNVLRRSSKDFTLDVIRKRFNGPYGFNFPDAAVMGILFDPGQPTSEIIPGGVRDRYKVRLFATISTESGRKELKFEPQVTGASVDAPKKLNVHVIDPQLEGVGPIEKNGRPGETVTFDYVFDPLDFRGDLVIKAEVITQEPGNAGKITTNAPIDHRITKTMRETGTLQVMIAQNAVPETRISIKLRLFTDMDEEVSMEVFTLNIQPPRDVTLEPFRDDFTLFPGVTAILEVNFRRAPTFMGNFFLDIKQMGSGLRAFFSRPTDQDVPPKEPSRTLRVVVDTAVPYVEDDTEIILVPLTMQGGQPIGDEVRITVRKRDQRTLFNWVPPAYSINQPGGRVVAELGFREPFKTADPLEGPPLARNESINVRVGVRNKAGGNASQRFRVFKVTTPGNADIDTTFFENAPLRRKTQFVIEDRNMGPQDELICYEIYAEVTALNGGPILAGFRNFFFTAPLTYMGKVCESAPQPIKQPEPIRRTTTLRNPGLEGNIVE